MMVGSESEKAPQSSGDCDKPLAKNAAFACKVELAQSWVAVVQTDKRCIVIPESMWIWEKDWPFHFVIVCSVPVGCRLHVVFKFLHQTVVPSFSRHLHEYFAFQKPIVTLFCSRIRIHYWFNSHLVFDWRRSY